MCFFRNKQIFKNNLTILGTRILYICFLFCVFLSFRSPCTNVAAKAEKLGVGSEKLKTSFGFSLALH